MPVTGPWRPERTRGGEREMPLSADTGGFPSLSTNEPRHFFPATCNPGGVKSRIMYVELKTGYNDNGPG